MRFWIALTMCGWTMLNYCPGRFYLISFHSEASISLWNFILTMIPRSISRQEKSLSRSPEAEWLLDSMSNWLWIFSLCLRLHDPNHIYSCTIISLRVYLFFNTLVELSDALTFYSSIWLVVYWTFLLHHSIPCMKRVVWTIVPIVRVRLTGWQFGI